MAELDELRTMVKKLESVIENQSTKLEAAQTSVEAQTPAGAKVCSTATPQIGATAPSASSNAVPAAAPGSV